MKTKNRLINNLLTFFTCLAVTAGTVALGGCGDAGIQSPANAQEPAPGEYRLARAPAPETVSPRARVVSSVRNIDVNAHIATVTQSLEAAHADTELALRRAGFDNVVDSIKAVDGIQLYDVEAEELVREVARRAEAHTPGQGRLVLAHLYQSAADQLPAVAVEPAFEPMRDVIRTTPAEALDPQNFRYASSVPTSLKPLGSGLEGAIHELGYVYSNGNLSELNRLVSRAFSRGRGTQSPISNRPFGRFLAGANTVEEAIGRYVLEHVPPPNSKQAIAEVMRHTNQLPAVAESRPFQAALAKISPEDLSFDANSDANYIRIADEQDTLPSRAQQARQAASVGARGSISSPVADSLAQVLAQGAQGGVQAGISAANSHSGVSRKQSAQHYASYNEASFKSGSSASTGAGGGGGRGARAYTVTRPPAAYAARVASSGAPKVARTYGSAIRSARAARGVAAGASLRVPNSISPSNLAWMANPDDDRFGRIVMEITNQKDASTSLVVTRTLFADSFRTAADVLWGGHYGPTAFNEGEILVVMSMDPFDVVDTKKMEEIATREKSIRARAQLIDNDDLAAQYSVIQEVYALQSEAAQMPRRVVVHPAAYGRELAWSVARVDFWFNDLNGLSNEGAMINGGNAMPVKFRGIDISQASTWQFFERDGTVIVKPKVGGLGQLAVRSGSGASASERSHYAVSMFVFDPDSDNPEGRRLPQLEKSLQPMLDWLAVNHHDFMRLNDFSEAFSILRWARLSGVSPLVMDVDGQPAEIATPDRVVIGEGPRAK